VISNECMDEVIGLLFNYSLVNLGNFATTLSMLLRHYVVDIATNIGSPNPKSNSIDTFSIKCKSSVGWHILKVGNCFSWVLISHFSSPYTYVGWHGGSPSTCIFFQVIRSACKAGDTFLYAKFHPT
jgi:hypothetical protein